ncbi:MAG: hypothetical protein RL708_1823 [Bacteroidota bacterium]|jgi:hypothetical protein
MYPNIFIFAEINFQNKTNLKMKKNLVLTIIALTMATTLMYSCKKTVRGCTDPTSLTYNSKANEDDGTCQYKGKVTFWNDVISGLGIVVVVMADGTSGNITLDKSSTPSCGASGCFTYEAKPGTYTYSAAEASPGTGTWSGTVTIASNGCTTVRLY